MLDVGGGVSLNESIRVNGDGFSDCRFLASAAGSGATGVVCEIRVNDRGCNSRYWVLTGMWE